MASEYGYKEFDATPLRSLIRSLIKFVSEFLGPAASTVLIEDWQ